MAWLGKHKKELNENAPDVMASEGNIFGFSPQVMKEFRENEDKKDAERKEKQKLYSKTSQAFVPPGQ